MNPPQRAIGCDGGIRAADVGALGSFAAIGVSAVGLWMLRDLEALGGSARLVRALALGLSVAVLAFCLPAVARRRIAPPHSGSLRSPASLSALLLAVLLGLAPLGFALHWLAWSALAVTALFAAIVFAVVMAEWWRVATLPERMVVPLLSGVLGAWMGACFWGYGMQHPAFLTKAALSQYVTSYNPAIDTFFHASLINAITNYSTVSVGLDGLVPLPYHALTHVFFSGLSALGGVTAIDFLNAASPIILLPLLPVSVLVFASAVCTRWMPDATERPLLARWPTWIVLFAALVGIVPQPFAGNHFLQWNLAIHSETYSLSMSLALLWAAFLVAGLSERFVESAVATPQDYNVLALAVVGVGLVTLTKISTGLVVLAGTGWLFLRLRLYRSPGAIAALASTFAGVAFFATLGAPTTTRNTMPLSPLAFFRQFIGTDHVASFIALNYILLFVYLLLRGLYLQRFGRGGDTAGGWRADSCPDVEFLGVLVVAGMLPGLVFDLPPKGPQSATINLYFMDVQALFAAGMLVALAASRQVRVLAAPPWAARLARALLPGLAVAALGIGILPNLLHEFRNVARQDDELRNLVRQHPHWSGAPEARMLTGLMTLGDGDRQRERVAVFVPQANAAYWQLRIHGCEVVPFLALGIAGAAMIDGLPPATCKSPALAYYGYQQYLPRDKTSAASPMTDARLCERAAQSALQEILILDAFPAAAPRRLNCRV